MESRILLHPENYGNLHLYFYLFALLLVYAILMDISIKKKVPVTSASLIILSTFLFSIVGGKLLSLSIPEWISVLKTGTFPDIQSKTILGYILFGLPAYLVTRKILKFNGRLGDAFAFAWPAGLAATRLGCITGGCCYGNPTQSLLGVSFGKGSLAYNDQLHTGLIQANQAVSLPVHPVPVYEIIFCVILIYGLYVIHKKKYLKGNGSLFYLSVCIYGVFRFFEEFIRPGEPIYAGLQKAQLIAVLLSIVTGSILWFKTKRRFSGKPGSAQESANRNMLTLMILLIVLILFSNWLTASELIFLQIISVFTVLIAAAGLYKQFTVKNMVAVPSFLIVFALILTAQSTSNPADSTFFKKKYFTFSAAGNFGREEQICGGYYDYSAFGVNIEKTIEYSPRAKFSYGSQAYLIQYDNIVYPGITPYVRLDAKYAGLRLGFDYSILDSEYKPDGLFPSLAFRLGKENGFFVDAHLADQLPSTLPVFQAGIGLGFKRHPGNYIRAGVSEAGFYLNPRFKLDDRFSLDPFFAYGSSNNFQMALRLHYSFSEKKD